MKTRLAEYVTKEQTITFGYSCQECGQGLVRETVFPEHRTRVRGAPFIVRDARIGVCDACGAKHFATAETLRWRQAFDEAQAPILLGPNDIRSIRNELQLSMEQFASLIGCTRQSIYNWERSNRKSVQSRMADLLLKLVRMANREGSVDVVSFLIDQARQQGILIEFGLPSRIGWKPLLLRTQRVSARTSEGKPLALAADTEGESAVFLVDAEKKNRVGSLSYEFGTASLVVTFSVPVEFDRFDVDIRLLKDRSTVPSRSVHVRHNRAVILTGTRYSEEDVESLLISPPGHAGGS